MLVQSLQFSSWRWCYLEFGNSASWSSLHFCFDSVSNSTLSVVHLSRGYILSSWWTFTYRQKHVRGYFRILWWIGDTRSKWLERQEYLVSQTMDFFIALRTSCAIVIAPSRILNFSLIFSKWITHEIWPQVHFCMNLGLWDVLEMRRWRKFGVCHILLLQ